MALKNVYKEVEKEKENKIKEKKMIYMSLEDFVKEHKELIRVLKSGQKSELLAEAEAQQAELDEEIGDEEKDEEEEE